MFDKSGTADEIEAVISSAALKEFFSYWKSLSDDDRFPSRDAFDPMAVPRFLPTVFLIEVSDDDFRYRLVGSLIEERYGRGSMKGLTPADVMGERAENVLVPYRIVRDQGHLFYREASLDWLHETRKYIMYKALLLPLSDDGQNVNMILGMQDFISQ